jgi:hypothetical protein
MPEFAHSGEPLAHRQATHTFLGELLPEILTSGNGAPEAHRYVRRRRRNSLTRYRS